MIFVHPRLEGGPGGDPTAAAAAVAGLHASGVTCIFGMGDTPDKKNSEWSICGLGQGGKGENASNMCADTARKEKRRRGGGCWGALFDTAPGGGPGEGVTAVGKNIFFFY